MDAHTVLKLGSNVVLLSTPIFPITGSFFGESP